MVPFAFRHFLADDWRADRFRLWRLGRFAGSADKFLTVNAVARPGNGLQAFHADRGITVNANAETAIGDSLQCSLNQTQAAAASAGACKQRFLRSRKTSKVDRVERSWACKVPYFRFGFLNRLQKLASLLLQAVPKL
jgi:hypothetical protein